MQDDPAFRTLRGTLNCRTTLLAGFTTVRNLGLFVKTGGYLLDVALARADRQRLDRRARASCPAGHAITPTGGHLDPTMFQRLGPGIMPLTVEEGIANGVPEVRKAVRYQIKYGARLIKISASGGVMSHSGLAGAQQYSDEELAAIVDEAHRAGLKVAAHAHGDAGIRAVHPRRRRLHRARLARERRDHPADGRARHVPRADELPVRRPRRLARRARAAGQGGRGVPAGAGDARQGDRGRREDRVRHRRARDPARRERQGAVGDGRPRHDADAGAAAPRRS